MATASGVSAAPLAIAAHGAAATHSSPRGVLPWDHGSPMTHGASVAHGIAADHGMDAATAAHGAVAAHAVAAACGMAAALGLAAARSVAQRLDRSSASGRRRRPATAAVSVRGVGSHRRCTSKSAARRSAAAPMRGRSGAARRAVGLSAQTTTRGKPATATLHRRLSSAHAVGAGGPYFAFLRRCADG